MADYERKDLDEKNFCAQCNVLIEETLLLTCDHNLCLPCAAKNLSKEDSKNIHKFRTVVCGVCFIQTTLDTSTANELLNMYPQYNLNKSIIKAEELDHKNTSKKNNMINESLLNMSGYSKNNVSSFMTKRELCKEHGEELTYYCLECLCRCICSECVVHGSHKNHEVMNVKRAYPIIVEKSEDLLYSVQSRIQEILNVQYGIDAKKKEINDNTNLIKQEVSQAFNEIRIRLQKKEKEILDKTDIFLQEHLQELSTYSRVLQTKIISLNKLVDSISSNISRKDEVGLLNFYSENKNRVEQTSESEIPEIPDFNTITNIKVNINQGSFDSLINSMNAIHMEISSTKGVELSKLPNTQKFAIKRDMYGLRPLANTTNNYNAKNVNLGHNNILSGNSSYAEMSKNNLNVSFKSLNSQNNSNIDDFSERYRKMNQI
jgi:tripartite motif-containing protein 63